MKPTIHRRDPEFYQRVAASLISRRLVARQTTRHAASKKCEAMAALLDRVATRMRKLPLKERLEFFRSSVAIVAEILAAMQRDTSTPARLTLAKAA